VEVEVHEVEVEVHEVEEHGKGGHSHQPVRWVLLIASMEG
jgi:hypothetical protein